MTSKTSVYKNSEKRTYDIIDAKRTEYQKISQASRLAKLAAEQGQLKSVHAINTPQFDPNQLMPQLAKNGLTSLSLFSGGGGLDLGFDRAGYEHTVPYELIPICKQTFALNRPDW